MSDNDLNTNQIDFLDKCYDMPSTEDKISSAVENYMKITNSDKKDEIKKSFSEFVESNNTEKGDINTLETMAKVAFKRLLDLCKECYMQKMTDPDSINEESVKDVIERVKRDYELIMDLN